LAFADGGGPDEAPDNLTRTPARGWAVLLLYRFQMSSVIVTSYTFGLFLPYIREDLELSDLEAGLLQGVWWVTFALFALPFGAWFSRFSPSRLVLVSLALAVPFLFLQGLATGFVTLFLFRLLFVACHVVSSPARTLLFQQWSTPRQYATISGVAASLHAVLLAIAVSTSALLITALDSWRVAYFIQGGSLLIQLAAWIAVAKESRAPVTSLRRTLQEEPSRPLQTLKAYPQAWMLSITGFGLAATWTALVTFLPTLWLDERGLALVLGGPLLGFLYFGLIPASSIAGFLSNRVPNRKLLLWVPALLNVALGIGITLTPNAVGLAALITCMGLLWVASPIWHVMPFELPGIRPREVAVVSALFWTFSGLGFAVGPVVTGLVAEVTGSVQTGLILLSLLTSVGVVSGLLYPRHGGTRRPSTGAVA